MSRKLVKIIAIIIVVAMVVTTFTMVLSIPGTFSEAYALGPPTAGEQKYLNEKLKELEEYLKIIHSSFKDEIDFVTLVNGAFEGAMYSLGDPYSVFFAESETGQQFIESVMGEYVGVGVTLKTSLQGFCEVESISPGSPAEKVGVKEGDLIIRVNGQNMAGKTVDDVSGLLRGEEGASVTITIRRGGNELAFTMIRAAIRFVSIDSKIIEGDIGYISLQGFELDGVDVFKEVKARLIRSGAKSLIIDVRDNLGGLIDTAIGIADEFIGRGDIVHLAHRGKVIETVKAEDKTILKMPVVLLVNENSASASEILAGALKDHKAAVLVGEVTYGKGVGQELGSTFDGHPYMISTFYFLTPNRHDIHEIGIRPDHLVINSLGLRREGELLLYKTYAPFVFDEKPGPGDSGLNVFAAQQRLGLLGYQVNRGTVMDDATVLAVKAFQGEQGLYPYGVLDFTTMRKLDEVSLAYIDNLSSEDLQLKKAIELLKQ
jgi:carboxyl-terminal processing protease